MADDGERRMLFDIRGKRKNVVRVVYAILALLMGTSLFFVVGPVNIGELIGNSANSDAAQIYEDEAERIEERLATEPANAALLRRLVRARISAGDSQLDAPSQSAVPQMTSEAEDEYEEALDVWNRYLERAGGEPDPVLAQRIAETFFRIAESDTSVRAAEEHVAQAAEAQRIAAREDTTVNSLTTLAYFEYFSGNFAAGDRAKREAEQLAASKSERQQINALLTEYRKNAQAFERRKQQLSKAEEQLGQGEGGGNPFALPGGE